MADKEKNPNSVSRFNAPDRLLKQERAGFLIEFFVFGLQLNLGPTFFIVY